MRFIKTIFLFIVVSTTAFSAPIDGLSSSAYMAGDSVIYNLDFIDPFGLMFFDVMVKSMTGGNEYITPLDNIGTPPNYLTTYEGTETYQNPSGEIKYYGRVESDSFVITQSYANSGNQFPPDSFLYADLAFEIEGDTVVGSVGPWLDLTGSAITYSDTRIYARLSNAGGGWPTSQGLNYFMYGFMLRDPENTELSATAMIYSDIPFIFPSGLYHMNLQDTSFTRLGDIQVQTDGGYLHMSCDIADLLMDPDWSQWPPNQGYAITGGYTNTVEFGQPTINDFTYPSAFIPETGALNTGQNNPPVLADYYVNFIPDLSINPEAVYFDSDNNLPVEKSFIFDNMSYEMGSFDHSYNDSSLFDAIISWPGEDWHTYYFRFCDGVDTIETALDSIYLTPITADDGTLPSSFSLSQNYPNPFNAKTLIKFELLERSDVELTVIDIMGNQVTILIEAPLEAGSHKAVWDGMDGAGRAVSSGIYFYSIKANNVTKTRKMLLIK